MNLYKSGDFEFFGINYYSKHSGVKSGLPIGVVSKYKCSKKIIWNIKKYIENQIAFNVNEKW